MDLEAFFNYFQSNFSLKKTLFTITLAQFTQIYIEYIEKTNKDRKDGGNKKSLRKSESMSSETMKKFIFGEKFGEQLDLISEKL